jgi:hypothetical protein
MKTTKPWILAAALLLVPAIAAAEGGIYLGAGVGQGRIRDEPTVPGIGTFSVDAKHSAYKGFVGYRFAGIPLIDLAAEAAYTDFGSPTQTQSGQSFEYKLHGPSAAGLVILPLGPLDLFGKWGVMSWNLDRTVNGAQTTNRGTSPVYGAGVGFQVWKVGVRAEYEYFAVKNIDSAQMMSVSVLFQF